MDNDLPHTGALRRAEDVTEIPTDVPTEVPAQIPAAVPAAVPAENLAENLVEKHANALAESHAEHDADHHAENNAENNADHHAENNADDNAENRVAPATPTRAWVRMPSGKRLDLLHPTADDWADDDLALGLARTYRWGGHSAWPLPLSVAQHSISVMLLRRAAATTPLSALQELRELLHDAEEGLLGFDCISVLKPFMGERFRQLTGQLEQAVFARYALPAWTAAEHAIHKDADRLAAASEAVHVVGWSPHEVRHTLGITVVPLTCDPLVAEYGGTAWEPWTPVLAAQRFMDQLERLLQASARAN